MDVTQIIMAVGLIALLGTALVLNFISGKKINKVKEEREQVTQEYYKLRILEIKSREKEVTHND